MSSRTASAVRVDEITPTSPLERLRWAVEEYARAAVHRVTRASQVEVHRLNSEAVARARHVVVMVLRNEADRIPYALAHHRMLGFEHFLIIDNESDDDLLEMLEGEPDVSTFIARGSYRRARVGNDWINHVLHKYCRDKWVLYVDADELLVYSHSDDTRIADVTARLESNDQYSLPCTMVDMYGEGPVSDNVVEVGEDPTQVCRYYDSTGYHRRLERMSDTVWIKGGVRARFFFPDIETGPALNKTPLVYWRRGYHFVKSAHQAWPASVNRPAANTDGRMDGALLHFRFLAERAQMLEDGSVRAEHTEEYDAYGGLGALPTLHGAMTHRYTGWQSLAEDDIIADVDWR